jgi:hypothetical protein
MILTAFSIYIKLSLTKDLTDAFHVAMLKYILNHLGLELGGIYDTWNSSARIRTPDFIILILQRIPIIFGPKFYMPDCHYAKFALWCATLASKEIRELDFPLYDGTDISKFGIYLTVALNRCQESRELVYLLKGDRLRNMALKQRYFTDIFNIYHEISLYIQRCERFFGANEKGDNIGTYVNYVNPPAVVAWQEPQQGFRHRLHTIKRSLAQHFHLCQARIW